MPRKLADFVLPLTVMLLALTLPGNAVAGPPEKIHEKLVFDEVADGLRKYRKETDPEKRMERLEKLARSRDPRVAIVLASISTDGLFGLVGGRNHADSRQIPRFR